MPAPECPCVDGLPDPCTVCGEPADGICKLASDGGEGFRAGAKAERERIVAWLEARVDSFTLRDHGTNRVAHELRLVAREVSQGVPTVAEDTK